MGHACSSNYVWRLHGLKGTLCIMASCVTEVEIQWHLILNRYAAALCMVERNKSMYQHILFFQLWCPCGTRWELSSSGSILFTSIWIIQSLLFLLGPVRERFFTSSWTLLSQSMSGFMFWGFFSPYSLLKYGHLHVSLSYYVYLVFPSLHLFNFKSVFVAHRKQTYTSSLDDFTLT